MNFKKLCVSAFLIFLSSIAIAANTDTKSTVTTTENQQAQTADRGLLKWLIVLNTNEIDAAKEVLKRKDLTPQVKAFAQLMVTQHTQLLQETQDLGKKLNLTPTNNENSRKLASEGKQELQELKALDDMNIQRPYINAMVTGHEHALTAINGYIKTEANPEVKKLLEITNHHVAMHLEQAQKVQKDIAA